MIHNNNNTHFIVKTSSARMPSNCWGKYNHVAVLEVSTHVDTVSMISDRARDCESIIAYWSNLNAGTTERCSYQKALKEAQTICNKLNKEKVTSLARRVRNLAKKTEHTPTTLTDADDYIQSHKQAAIGSNYYRKAVIATASNILARQ